MYRQTTHGIEITVRPEFLEEESAREQLRWFWAYTVIIANHSERTVQLESRYWRITNAAGEVEEVSGLGVIGEQPVLGPGDSFQYTSGCPLNTASGTMFGHFIMRLNDGNSLVAKIPPFSLDLPGAKRVLN
ncbi:MULTISPECIES: Co2+/Mg2+ efflux protein ApaG [Ahrensia]|jgi:ApaG protein|uniref:Protein ApaG n=1 Tax=Ahrensia kielensis TaxID=76980 RepID=A0ABU9T1K3_9HYPH|nr:MULTISPECIES: Co2+/Mg2+ efflux protein ApaG [Ahrensia]